MNKSELIRLLRSAQNVSEMVRDLEEDQAALISEKPGTYTTIGLIKELQIRIASAANSGISVIGDQKLFSALGELREEACLHSYGLKTAEKKIFIYLTCDDELIIGLLALPLRKLKPPPSWDGSQEMLIE